MYFTKMFIPTLREAPSDADIVSARLMQRSGMIRKLASGIFEWLPMGLKVLKKVEQIIREEMNSAEGQEVWLPLLLPKDLWEETGRWNVYGKELFRLKDRKESEFCLGPTHEEVITDLVRREIRSYRQLPIMLYQFGIKFRDEIRPRFGIMRAREFYMKDAYSFHVDEEDLDSCYNKVFEAYKRICERCGFKYRAVEAATGAIGGSSSHEFMVLAETGEEEISWCDCGYGANVEKSECVREKCNLLQEDHNQLKEVSTPHMKSVDEVSGFLKAKKENFIKTLIYTCDGEPVMVLIRGDHEVNEVKLKSVLCVNELFLSDEKMVEGITGAPLGFAGPVSISNSKVRIIADYSVESVLNGISGANKKDFHLLNININRDYKPEVIADIRKVKHGDSCTLCGKKLKFSRGIEIGHTFKLGLKYSKAMKAVYLDADGKENNMVMGCYGIGVSRILAATIEQSNDENGIIWPIDIAPFKVVIIPINWNEEKTKGISKEIYSKLVKMGIDVLLDDRDERAGIKFKDADLVGIPYRITIGEKNLKDNNVEFKARWESKEKSRLIPLENVYNEVSSLLGKVNKIL